MFEVYDKTTGTTVCVTGSYFEACDWWLDRRRAFPEHDINILEYSEYEEGEV